MATLEKIKSMREEGRADEEIVQELREQGLNPLEISEAFEQSNIKAAVSPEETLMMNQAEQGEEYSEESMQPSVISEEMPGQYEEVEQPAETQEYMYPTPQPYSGAGYEEYQPYQQTTETTTEIAEQIAEEKLIKVKKELSSISSFKMIAESSIKNIDDRLKRIEEIIDRLQATIIGKIGSYGQNLQDVKKEMILMQESFSKALPSIKEKKLFKKEEKSESKSKKAEKSGKKANIEHYLRR